MSETRLIYEAMFLDLIPAKGKTVIDVGCGDGWASFKLKEKGADVTALDIMPESNRKLAKLRDSDIPYVAKLEAGQEKDIAWCCHVLEHISSPIHFLLGLRKIAKQLWVSVPCAHTTGFAKGHINNYTMPILIEHLRRSGWDIENGSCTTYPKPNVGSLWAVVKRFDDFDEELFDPDDYGRYYHDNKQALSKYPSPMDVFNAEGENHLRNDFHSWNWEAITK